MCILGKSKKAFHTLLKKIERPPLYFLAKAFLFLKRL